MTLPDKFLNLLIENSPKFFFFISTIFYCISTVLPYFWIYFSLLGYPLFPLGGKCGAIHDPLDKIFRHRLLCFFFIKKDGSGIIAKIKFYGESPVSLDQFEEARKNIQAGPKFRIDLQRFARNRVIIAIGAPYAPRKKPIRFIHLSRIKHSFSPSLSFERLLSGLTFAFLFCSWNYF